MRYLRSTWQDKIELNPKLGIALIVFFGILKYTVVLNAHSTQNFQWVPLVFIAMLITPFILLTNKGHVAIGYNRPKSHLWAFYSFLLGIGTCAFVFFIGEILFKDTNSNWFVYISKSFEPALSQMNEGNKIYYFLAFSAISVTFGPLGEEFLYRGLIHRCFSYEYDDNDASMVDSAAFALSHLCHFGIVFIAGAWDFLFFPALVWLFLMYLTGRMFFIFRTKTGSLFGAIAGHAGFNFAMMFFIFYFIL
jgi:membrane protease YdiL (CAAX protease family)